MHCPKVKSLNASYSAILWSRNRCHDMITRFNDNPTRTYGCESWTISAADRKRLNAFELDGHVYRRMLRISWTEHRTNNSILEEMEPARRFLAEIKRRNLQYFGHVVRADDLCTHVLHGIVAEKKTPRIEEDHRDAGLTTSSNGLEYPSQSLFSTQKTEARVWCPCQWPPILLHEDGPRQGKARQQ